jgi:hypothetical protein
MLVTVLSFARSRDRFPAPFARFSASILGKLRANGALGGFARQTPVSRAPSSLSAAAVQLKNDSLALRMISQDVKISPFLGA